MKREKNKKSLRARFGSNIHVKWGFLIGVTVIFTVIYYPNLVITRDVYNLGDVVERDVKAPKDFFVEDKHATEANRSQAVEGVLTVYDHDETLSSALSRSVNQAFGNLRKVFDPESEVGDEVAGEQSEAGLAEADSKTILLLDRIQQMKGDFEETLGITVSSGAYKILENEKFSQEIADLISRILTTILENGVVTNKELLLRETDKGIRLRTVGTNREIVVHKLKQFYGLDQAKTMVRIVGQPLLKDLNYNLRNLIVDFVQRLIPPNITLNRSETEERKKRPPPTSNRFYTK